MITDFLRSTRLGTVSPATMSSTSELLQGVPTLHMSQKLLEAAALHVGSPSLPAFSFVTVRTPLCCYFTDAEAEAAYIMIPMTHECGHCMLSSQWQHITGLAHRNCL